MASHRCSCALFAVLAVTAPLTRTTCQQPDRGQEPDRGQAPRPAATESAPDLSIQEWLLARTKHQDYEKATFNFEHGVRDDPELTITRNDWDLLFGNDGEGAANDTFDVRMVRDDISLIADLGESTFADVDPGKAAELRMLDRVVARVGHTYLVHTMDTETDRVAMFRVLAHRPRDSVRIEWVAFEPRGIRTSPGLSIDTKLEQRLVLFVRTLDRVGGLRRCLRESGGPSERTFDLLEDTIVKAMPVEFGGLLDRLAELPDVKLRLPDAKPGELETWRKEEIPEDLRVRSFEHALEAVTRALRMTWTVRTDGSIVVRKV